MLRKLLIALLISGVLCVVYSYSLVKRYEWMPVSKTLLVKDGQKGSYQFEGEGSFDYELILTNLRVEDLRPQITTPIIDDLQYSYEISGDKGFLLKGNSKKALKGRTNEKSFDFVLATVPAKDGEKYNVQLTIQRFPQKQPLTNPGIKVIVGLDLANHIGLRGATYLFMGLLLFSFSMLIGLYLVMAWVKDKNRALLELRETLKGRPSSPPSPPANQSEGSL
jgi:hypothetical protein